MIYVKWFDDTLTLHDRGVEGITKNSIKKIWKKECECIYYYLDEVFENDNDSSNNDILKDTLCQLQCKDYKTIQGIPSFEKEDKDQNFFIIFIDGNWSGTCKREDLDIIKNIYMQLKKAIQNAKIIFVFYSHIWASDMVREKAREVIGNDDVIAFACKISESVEESLNKTFESIYEVVYECE